MPSVNVNIKPEIIKWALRQTEEDKIGEKLMENVTAWLNGTKIPTFRQVEDLSKKTNIPLGYFFLQTPPEEQIKLLEYRTINSINMTNPSRNLIDTINEMDRVQEWMKTYRQDFGFGQLPIVGCMKGINEEQVIANRIRKDLELDDIWYEEGKDIRENFNHLREQLEINGILIMMNGIVGSNTHRPLDINEFRAFTLIDNWAPLIFINATDSDGAKLFSLLHEAAHIWLGEDDLFNDRQSGTTSVSDIEKICNAVAAEILVPRNIFLDKWDEYDADPITKNKKMAKYFHCGEIVVGRKALDCAKISQDIYNQIVQTTIGYYNKNKEKKGTGGNYYNNMGSRLDAYFVRALCESVKMGRTSYIEACHLTNTNPNTFLEIANNFGGVI